MDPALHAAFQLVAQKARSLDELLTIGCEQLSSGTPRPEHPGQAACEILDSWQASFARDDRGAFERRLGWDGLTYQDALDRLSLALDAGQPSLPAWIDPLVQVLGEPATSDSMYGSSADPVRSDDIPFAPLWRPFARFAANKLWRQAGDDACLISDRARVGLERQLLGQLTRASEDAMLGWFDDYKAKMLMATEGDPPAAGSPSTGIFRSFVHSMYSGGFISFFLRYPVVARQACTLIHTWISAELEFLSRLRADLPEIEDVFCQSSEAGPLDEISGSLSDRHHGGRRVHGLRFASGLRLIYKPRDVGTEVAFQSLLTWMRQTGLDCVPRAIRMLERDGYGWAEFVHRGEISDIGGVEDYYRRAGCHLCLGYMFRAADLHMDNVIASPDGPVLIDLELILRPELPMPGAVGSPAKTGGEGVADSSPLESGYLTSLRVDPAGRIYDIGGLYGLGGHLAALAQRTWKDANADAMRCESTDVHAAPENNVLCRDGRPQMAECFAAAIIDGFTATYRWTLERKSVLLADGGPLSSFARRRIRFLLRDSNQYGTILHAILTAPFQKAGHFPGILMDSMNRGLQSAPSAPRMWRATGCERLAMERLDVPYFSMLADGVDVHCDDEIVVPGLAGMSGLEAAAVRIRALDEADLAKQVGRLQAALPPVPWGAGSYLEIPEDPRRSKAQIAAPMVRAAWGVAEIVRKELASSVPGGSLLHESGVPESIDRMRAAYLYDGSAGIAVFLAALARTMDSPDDGASALSIVRETEALLRDAGTLPHPLPVGACNGLGGIVYAGTLVGALLDAPTCLETAGRAAGLIDPESAGRASSFDVEGGIAGAILCILALHRVAPQDSMAELARRCGDVLLAGARPGPDGGQGWPGADGIMRAGFAHGAAGIAYALGRLSSVTGDEVYRSAAMEAIVFERKLYDDGARNWPVVVRSDPTGPDTRIVMNAWCHGAPGIALSRIGLIDRGQDDDLRREAESALITTLRSDFSDKDHLCCGNMGRVGVLDWSGQMLGKLELQRAASARVLVVLERALTKGHFTVPSDDTTGAHPSIGLFRGLSGVGYEILRQIEPRELPCVLLFRPPARGHP